MEPHQLRVVEEKQELDAKRDKLIDFLNSKIYPTLPPEERDRLSEQARLMREYSDILRDRIKAF